MELTLHLSWHLTGIVRKYRGLLELIMDLLGKFALVSDFSIFVLVQIWQILTCSALMKSWYHEGEGAGANITCIGVTFHSFLSLIWHTLVPECNKSNNHVNW